MKRVILTLVPNPALDKSAIVPGFSLGRIFRVSQTLSLAGGKGFNVARALRTLSAEPLVSGVFGGHTGAAVLSLAAAEGIVCKPLLGDNETRTCLTIIDPDTDTPTELYERGAALDDMDWERLEDLVTLLLQQASLLVVAGSFPPGGPATALRELVERAHAAGVRALLDSYGPPLLHALDARPALVKINQAEAADATGVSITDVAHGVQAAEALQARGSQEVVITLGKRGAVGIDSAGERFGWAAPEVSGVYPTGSGDSLFAGVVAGLAQGAALREAVRLGVAAGAANTLQMGAGVFARGQVDALLPEVRPLRLDG